MKRRRGGARRAFGSQPAQAAPKRCARHHHAAAHHVLHLLLLPLAAVSASSQTLDYYLGIIAPLCPHQQHMTGAGDGGAPASWRRGGTPAAQRRLLEICRSDSCANPPGSHALRMPGR